MKIGETVKKGFTVAASSGQLILILFLFGVTWNLVNIFTTRDLDAAAPGQPSPLAAALGFLFLFISIFFQSGSLAYIRDNIKSGGASLSGFVSEAGKYYLRLLFLGLLIAAIVGLFLITAGFAVATLQTAGIVIAVLLAGIGIYLIALVFLSPYIVVAEDEKVIASVKKSVGIVRKNILRVLGIALILVLIGFLVGVIFGLLLGVLTLAVQGTASDIVAAVISSMINAVLGVFVTSTFMAFYLSNKNSTSGAE